MKLISQRSFHGPSQWSSTSGLLLVIEDGQRPLDLLEQRPGPARMESMLAILRGAFAVAADSLDLTQPERLLKARAPMLALLFATTEVLLRDFNPQPTQGWPIRADGRRLWVFVPCDEHDIGLSAWQLAAKAIDLLSADDSGLAGDPTALLRDDYWRYRRRARRLALDQTSVALVRTALRRGIPYTRISPAAHFVQLGQGCRRKRINESATDDTSALGNWLSGDKLTVSTLLARLGLPTTGSCAVASVQQAVAEARRIGFPVVVKPRASGKGHGVSANLQCEQDVVVAFERATRVKSGVLVERHIAGEDHRLLVVAGRFVAAARREPASVIGDGRLTLRQLVERLNRDPRRGMRFERLMEWVEFDDEAKQVLDAAGLNPDSVVQAGRQVFLRRTANLSRGGSAVDVTDSVHPDNRALAERAAALVGLDVAGIDLLTRDIGRSWKELACAVLEVNATPGLRPHLAANPDRDVLGPIVEHLFPDAADGRVPTAGITGSIGKTTTCRMLASILASQGRTVALSTTQGAYVGGDTVRLGDVAGGRSATHLLLDPRVQAGVFELARGGLVKAGMVLDACDVGAVLNVLDNHLGLDGLHTRDDLARVKRVVVQHARRMAVLNADDACCLAMREHVSAPRLCLVSAQADNAAVHAHLAAGGVAAFLDGDGATLALKLFEGPRLLGSMPAAEIPAAWGGLFRPALVNALFASALAFGMGVDYPSIRAALGRFESTFEHNPGRMNFVDGLPYRVLVTWSDGPEAMRELARFVERLEVSGERRLMVSVVGNRPDTFVVDTAKSAAGLFSTYVCSDWADLRGRPAGLIAGLLAQGLREGGVDEASITVAASHDAGLDRALAQACAGDLLVIVSYSSTQICQSLRPLRG